MQIIQLQTRLPQQVAHLTQQAVDQQARTINRSLQLLEPTLLLRIAQVLLALQERELLLLTILITETTDLHGTMAGSNHLLRKNSS